MDKVHMDKNLDLKTLVTFVPNRTEPIHNWYWYKEGFSRALVDRLIDKFRINQSHTVLDPFCGVGTTLLACKQRWIKSIGFDTSPLAVFVSSVKTGDYNFEYIEDEMKKASKWKFEKPEDVPNDKFLKRAFSKYALEDLVFLKEKLNEVNNKQVKRLLGLALMDSTLKASYIYKDGSVAKIMKQRKPPLRLLFSNKVRRMLKNLKMNETPKIDCSVDRGDARNLELKDESVNFVITSPPYLNKIEYTAIYKLENYLFFDGAPENLRSFVGGYVEEVDISGIADISSDGTSIGEMPPVAHAYFSDMDKVCSEMFRVCKPGAKVAVVIGGGCLPEVEMAVNSDELISKLLSRNGFKIDEIEVARESWCTVKRTKKIGKIRESVVIAEK